MTKPYLFTFEGLDGAGKTTNVARLREELDDRGHPAVALSSPSRSVLGRFIRTNMMELNPELKDELFVVDMRDSLRTVSEGLEVVLFDRYVDSIYTSNTETTKESMTTRAQLLPVAHRTFLLDISPEQSWEREGELSNHPLDIEWLRQKHLRYRELTHTEPERFHIIDASKKLDEVFGEILHVVMADIVKIERVES